jgi:2-oxoglutarate dehydrogenase E1 component
MDSFSFIANADTQVIADLYEVFQKDPNSVDPAWRDFFKGFDFAQTWQEESVSTNTIASSNVGHVQKEMSVISLIKAARAYNLSTKRSHRCATYRALTVSEDQQAN